MTVNDEIVSARPQPILSIVVPYYNASQHYGSILKCLNSISSSDNAVEVIFVDDGSTQEPINECLKFLTNTLDVHCFSKKNEGVSSARNFGLLRSRGRYVLFFDIDDMLLGDHLLELIQILVSSLADVVICQYSDLFLSNSREEIHLPKVLPEVSPGDFLLNYLEARRAIWIGCIVFSRAFLIEAQLRFNEKFAYGEDQDFIIRALLWAKSTIAIDKILAKYVRHDGSAMAKFSLRRLDTLAAYKALRNDDCVTREYWPGLVRRGRLELIGVSVAYLNTQSSTLKDYRKFLNSTAICMYKSFFFSKKAAGGLVEQMKYFFFLWLPHVYWLVKRRI